MSSDEEYLDSLLKNMMNSESSDSAANDSAESLGTRFEEFSTPETNDGLETETTPEIESTPEIEDASDMGDLAAILSGAQNIDDYQAETEAQIEDISLSPNSDTDFPSMEQLQSMIDELPEEIDIPEEMPVEDIQTEQLPVEEMPTEELLTEEMPTEELLTEDMPAEELLTEDMPAEELLVEEMPTEEFPTEEAISEELPTGETLPEEIQAEDLVEMPSETAEMLMEEMEMPTEELPAEEIPSEEFLSEEMPTEELLTEEMPTEELLSEDISEEEIVEESGSDELNSLLDSLNSEKESNPNKVLSTDEIAAMFDMVASVTPEPEPETEPEPEPEPEIESEQEIESMDELGDSDGSEMAFDLDSDDLGELNALLENDQNDEPAEQDLEALLNSMGDDADVAEIGDLLKKSDNNEIVDDDILGMFNDEGMSDDSMPETEADDAETDEAGSGKKRKKKEKKKKEKKEGKKAGLFSFLGKKKKKDDEDTTALDESAINELDGLYLGAEEDSNADIADLLGMQEEESVAFPEMDAILAVDSDGNPIDDITNLVRSEEEPVKKQGFFSKIIGFLTEEDEEDIPEKQQLSELSEENEGILAELDAEAAPPEDKKSKKKKGKKDKKKKGDNSEGGDEEEQEDDSKKSKKKPKKEKKVKEKKPEEPVNEKKLSKKKVIPIFVLCFSLMAAVLLVVSVVPGLLNKSKARRAYYEKDYRQVYDLLSHEKLNQSDQIMFDEAKMILKLERKYKTYQTYKGMGMEAEALDMLLQGVVYYNSILDKAGIYDITSEINAIYSTIMDRLASDYGLTSDQIAEIIACEEDVEYSKKIYTIVYGFDYSVKEEERVLEDIRPEEQEMLERVGESGIMQDIPVIDQTAVQPEEAGDVNVVDEMPENENLDTPENSGQIINDIPQPIDVTIR